MKETRRSLLTSVTAFILCFVMLVGTTFAWFTDSATSANNIIKAGSLDISMEWSKDNANWNEAEGPTARPIFDYRNWEPGYTEVRYIKVQNLGSLAFKYQMAINPTGAIGKLAEVIDVSYDIVTDNASFVAPTAADKQGSLKKVSTLSELISGTSIVVGGVLLPDGETAANHYSGEIVICVTFHMQETAGNEYQGASIGDAFGINLYATQYDYENDSFDNSYDNGATWPSSPVVGNTATVPVNNNNGVLADAVTMTSADGKISATLPAGTKLEPGVTNATLSVSDVENSQANITLTENEAALSLDVHISGVAEDNDVPTIIYLAEALPVGLNMGNYSLYHVEDGNTNVMTYVADVAELDVHNEFAYDPATGNVTLCMESFSEVAMVAETPKWEGNIADGFNGGSGSEEDPYIIANADQLAYLSAVVGGMIGFTADSFKDKYIKLVADIDLNDNEKSNKSFIFYPIGYYNSEGTYERTNTAITSGLRNFEGTFDGNGHTVSNFYHNTWEMKGDHDWYSPEEQYYRDGMGLFGRVYGGTVKNLTVKNFSSDGEIATTGVIAAYADFGATFENIAIFDCNPRVYNIGNGGIVGCVGWYTKGETETPVTFRNITVDNSNKISALWGSYDVACGGIVGQYYPTSGQSSANYPVNAGIYFENCHISAQMDVYNDVCANYQYYAYRYTGMLIGSVRENETINGYVYPKMDGITASGCTVHFGTWNDYYYCEIIDNTTASYTHDYQMSRLTEIKAIDGTTITYLDGTTGTVPATGRANYVIVDYSKGHGTENATCYHFKDGAVWTHDMGGIQTGIDENGDGQDDLKEDKQHIYLEFNNLVTGYGWGVTSRGFHNLDGVTNLDIEEGNQESSVEKFEDAGYTPKDYRQGETITIGDLFKVKGNAVINGKSVYVSVSPVTDGDKVSATFTLNEEDWTKSTISFSADSTGTAKVTITDYIFCNPTTIYLNEEEAKTKFTNNSVSAQEAYTQITLGELFSVNNGATIGNVTATVTDPNGNKTTVTGTSSDWATQIIDLIKEGTWTVSITDDDKYCAATETTFTVNKVDKFTKKFDKNFLYRVGNENTVEIGYIFGEIETAVGLSSVNATIENVAGNAAGTYTAKTPWTSGTIQFTGTGVVRVTISADGANPVEINLEVVDAANSASAVATTTGGNFVLVCDVNTDKHCYLWNCTVFGNGFTYSLNGAPTAYNSKQGKGILIANNAVLDNLVIVGDEYTGYGAFSNNDYYNTAIDVTGDTIIQNCYISGCSAPVRARNNVTIINSTLYGGAVGNLIIEDGTATLENVTTANYDDGRALVGMGIVIHSDATESASLVINGTLTQYNFISEEKVPSDSYAKGLHTAMFGSSCSTYHFGTSSNRYVNTGIISLTSTFNIDDITDNANTGYVGQVVSESGFNGYVYTQPNTSGSVNNNYKMDTDTHIATTQGAVSPSYSFDYSNKNYIAKTEGSNDYCYAENGKVNISMDDGDTFNWDTSILTIGKNITNYTVSMNGVDYTGKSIAFNTAGDYTVTYTYTDSNNYKLDANGNITTYSVIYTKVVNITVAVVKATTKHAEFTFGSSNTASTTVTVGNSTYVMPNVSGTSSTIGSTTVDGKTIYYPIVEIIMSDGTTSHTSGWYAYFPVFSDVVTITDYADNGTGDKQNPYNGSTTTMPSGLSVVGDPKTLFKYQSGSNADSSPSVKNNKLVYSSAKIEANRDEYNTVVQYSYTDNAGATYYYYVGYHASSQSYTNCITSDTLITLADGSQVRVDSLTGDEMLLVWNMETGKFDYAPIMFVDSEAEAEFEVIKLYFSDGTEVKVIAEHGFWDYDLNKYVYLDRNAADYIGHTFAKQNGDKLEKVTLTDVVIETELTTAWSPVTVGHLCYFVNGMLSMPGGVGGLFNIFEVDPETMTYDYEQLAKDIETYGLFTYEELNAICPLTEEMFNAAGGAYLKISIGKGNLTMDELIYMINRYSKFI